jgi:hypothetical protein
MAAAAPNPNPNENGPERARKIFNSSNPSMDEDIRSKLMRNNAYSPAEEPLRADETTVTEPTQPAETRRPWWSSGIFPLFWTVASALSLTVNVLLCLLVLGLLSYRGPITKIVTGQSTSILGGLYSNFQAMDNATIKTSVQVDTTIPLSIQVPVQTQTQITLAQPVTIHSPRVLINTGVLRLDAPAQVTLPAGTPMMVNLNFMLPVQTSVPVHLDVPVNIPLNQTELHQPFVGLQEVVRPWYCLFLPKSETLFMQNCVNTKLPSLTGSIVP